jgi:hypothetical protein
VVVDHVSGGPRADDPKVSTDTDKWPGSSSFFAPLPNPRYKEGELADDIPALVQWRENKPPKGGLCGLPEPYCDPFRRMLDCPALVHALNCEPQAIELSYCAPPSKLRGLFLTTKKP